MNPSGPNGRPRCGRETLRRARPTLPIPRPSTPRHSYGKTPLFYATTRCRNEVVQLLLARGAKTRVLNNKGQSVLSLAASHLKPEVIDALVLAEREEGQHAQGALRPQPSVGLPSHQHGSLVLRAALLGRRERKCAPLGGRREAAAVLWCLPKAADATALEPAGGRRAARGEEMSAFPGPCVEAWG